MSEKVLWHTEMKTMSTIHICINIFITFETLKKIIYTGEFSPQPTSLLIPE